MTDNAHDGPARRPPDHSWILVAWVMPLVVTVLFTIATAGFGAIFVGIAIVIGLVSTVLHHQGRTS